MPTALLLARLALAAVLMVAALAKLTDRAGSRRAFVGFGVPDALAGPLGLALPLAELFVAALLLPAATAAAGALAATALLATFAAAIAVNLARGRRPDCNCFGARRARPISPATLVRNLALAALAGAVAWAGRGGDAGPGALAALAGSPLGTPTGALLAGAYALVAGLGWGLVGVLRQNGRLLLRVEALEAAAAPAPAAARGTLPVAPPSAPLGAPAPDLRLPTADGSAFDPAGLRGAEAVVVLWNPRCGYCQRMLPDLHALEAGTAGDPDAPRLVVVSAGTAQANRAQGLRAPVLLDDAFAVGRALGARGTPSAVRLDAAGRVASAVAVGAEAVLALARGARPVLVP